MGLRDFLFMLSEPSCFRTFFILLFLRTLVIPVLPELSASLMAPKRKMARASRGERFLKVESHEQPVETGPALTIWGSESTGSGTTLKHQVYMTLFRHNYDGGLVIDPKSALRMLHEMEGVHLLVSHLNRTHRGISFL